MLINRMQTKDDVEVFRNISADRIESILANTPEYRRGIMADILKAFLLKINIPIDEAENLASKMKEKKMGELFADIEEMDFNVKSVEAKLTKRWK